jgi:hypothetical protein
MRSILGLRRRRRNRAKILLATMAVIAQVAARTILVTSRIEALFRKLNLIIIQGGSCQPKKVRCRFNYYAGTMFLLFFLHSHYNSFAESFEKLSNSDLAAQADLLLSQMKKDNREALHLEELSNV